MMLGALTGLLLAAWPASAAPDPSRAATLQALPLRPVAPAAASWPKAPAVVLFWRADCAPCRLELADLRDLRAAAAPLPVLPVGLQSAAELKPALKSLRLSPRESARTDADAAEVLTRYGGAPPRLPLAVAFGPDGRVCGRHTGYLGTDQLRAWARACGGAGARG